LQQAQSLLQEASGKLAGNAFSHVQAAIQALAIALTIR
jgi:hypothetical protein